MDTQAIDLERGCHAWVEVLFADREVAGEVAGGLACKARPPRTMPTILVAKESIVKYL